MLKALPAVFYTAPTPILKQANRKVARYASTEVPMRPAASFLSFPPSTKPPIIKKAYSSTGEDPNILPTPYTISFCDSGAGGAIFGIHAFSELVGNLTKMMSTHDVRFSWRHLGYASKAPFGGQSPEAISGHAKSMLYHATRTYSARMNIIACNTACSVINEDFETWNAETLPGTELITIIKDTVRSSYSQASKIAHGKNKRDIHIGILATPATIKSQEYQRNYAYVHSANFPGQSHNAITVIIQQDPRIDPEMKLSRVYIGATPLAPRSPEENEAIRAINAGENKVPVLYVLAHGPADWVSIMEQKKPGNLSQEVTKEMHHFISQAEENTLLAVRISALDVLVLGCTHYPNMGPEIKVIMESAGVAELRLITQGEITANIIWRRLQSLIDYGKIPERRFPIPVEWLEPSVIQFTSDTVVDPKKPEDIDSFNVVKKVSFETNPLISRMMKFNTIPPIKEF